MLIGRSDRGALAQWWFTVDRVLLTAVFLLMAAGVLASLAASPAAAARLDYASFHFVMRQVVFLMPAIGLLLAMSFASPKAVRRSGLAVFFIGLALMVVAILFGPETKGAHRWISLGVFKLQPSEFTKPAFVVAASWLMAEASRKPDMPGNLLAWGLFAAFTGLLILQPDFGQTVLIGLVWAVMLLVNGIAWAVVLALVAAAAIGMVLAYRTIPHVTSRIDRFLDPANNDTFQTDKATQAFHDGGVLGTGPGEGLVKWQLPDAHTDFIFAVIGEEFGLIACAGLIALAAFVLWRVLSRALREPDPFVALSLTGLIAIFGFQTVINMGVNVSLLPAKGMTLPFVSYGGSSLLAMSYAMGMVLALGRNRAIANLPAERQIFA